ncbi:hypothetical protein PgNI_06688 [Pyricularia grisea]|uniref:Uncharacterized protein n=1 Tax=Pyricularia grisea TaxID=148305 RepID=A0A6P8B7E8_PYRGI|nr:hypothetical protein PgNI_06688 [Pyricularia grisea]TLD11168.1 hypothetical protein PgNI_06688 [Pyricularia grisea]
MKLVGMRGPCSPLFLFATFLAKQQARLSMFIVMQLRVQLMPWGLESSGQRKKNRTDERKWTPKGLWANHYELGKLGLHLLVLADFDSGAPPESVPSAGAAVGGLDV